MTEALFAEFDASTYDDWVEAARASLGGRTLERIVSATYEGIDIAPLPHADCVGAGLASDGIRGAGRARPWLIANEIDIAAPDDFNAALKTALANGQTAITVGRSLRLEQAGDTRAALAGIDLPRYPILLLSGGRSPEIYRLLQAPLNEGDLRRLTGCAGYDPLGAAARSGSLPADAFDALAAHVANLEAGSPDLGSIAVDASPYHDAGANAAQELAIALATGVAYLRELGGRGFAAEFAAEKLHVSLGIGENFFMEVAKFRAIKSLWAQMLRAFGVSAASRRIRLHARGGLRNKTRRERHVNLLRLTSETLAAALGGVDSICLPAFDAPSGASDEFSRRLSRNIQLILQEEAQVTKLIDPAGGAWHIERLTDQLARKAWRQFQRIEAAGGILAALQSGAIQAEVATVAERRRQDLAAGKSILVGANAYVNEAEPLPPARSLETADSRAYGIRVEPLRPLRLAEDFELPRHAAGAGA